MENESGNVNTGRTADWFRPEAEFYTSESFSYGLSSKCLGPCWTVIKLHMDERTAERKNSVVLVMAGVVFSSNRCVAPGGVGIVNSIVLQLESGAEKEKQ